MICSYPYLFIHLDCYNLIFVVLLYILVLNLTVLKVVILDRTFLFLRIF